MQQSIECVRKALMNCSSRWVRSYSPLDLDTVIVKRADWIVTNCAETVEVTFRQRTTAAKIIDDMSRYRSAKFIGVVFDISTIYVAITKKMQKKRGQSSGFRTPAWVITRILTRYGQLSDIMPSGELSRCSQRVSAAMSRR